MLTQILDRGGVAGNRGVRDVTPETQSSGVGLGSKAGLESRLLTEAPSFHVQRTLRKKLTLTSLGRQLGSVTALIGGGSDASLIRQLCGRETRGARGERVAGEHPGFTCRPARQVQPLGVRPIRAARGLSGSGRAPRLDHKPRESGARPSLPSLPDPQPELGRVPRRTSCFTSLITPSSGEGGGRECWLLLKFLTLVAWE